jgi:putative FmdB family regulatory protein
MPIYEYRCSECGKKFEKLLLSISSTSQVECPRCGGRKVEKLFSLFGTKASESSSTACGPVG